MSSVFDDELPAVAAVVTRDLEPLVDDANDGVGEDQRDGLADEGVRNRIGVGLEADKGGLVDDGALDLIGLGQVLGESEQASLLLDEALAHGAVGDRWVRPIEGHAVAEAPESLVAVFDRRRRPARTSERDTVDASIEKHISAHSALDHERTMTNIQSCRLVPSTLTLPTKAQSIWLCSPMRGEVRRKASRGLAGRSRATCSRTVRMAPVKPRSCIMSKTRVALSDGQRRNVSSMNGT